MESKRPFYVVVTFPDGTKEQWLIFAETTYSARQKALGMAPAGSDAKVVEK